MRTADLIAMVVMFAIVIVALVVAAMIWQPIYTQKIAECQQILEMTREQCEWLASHLR